MVGEVGRRVEAADRAGTGLARKACRVSPSFVQTYKIVLNCKEIIFIWRS